LGTLNSWNPLGHPRSVTGLLYLTSGRTRSWICGTYRVKWWRNLKDGCPLAEVGVDGRILNWIWKEKFADKVDWINPSQKRDKV